MDNCAKNFEKMILSQASVVKSVGISLIRKEMSEIQGSLQNPLNFIDIARNIINSIHQISPQRLSDLEELSKGLTKEADFLHSALAKGLVYVGLFMRYWKEAPIILLSTILLILIGRLSFYYRKLIFYLNKLESLLSSARLYFKGGIISSKRLEQIIRTTCEELKGNPSTHQLRKLKDLNCNALKYYKEGDFDFRGFIGNLYQIISVYNIILIYYTYYRLVRFLIKIILAHGGRTFTVRGERFLYELFKKNCSNKPRTYDEMLGIISYNCDMLNALTQIPIANLQPIQIRKRDIGDPPEMFDLDMFSEKTTYTGYEVNYDIFVTRNNRKVAKFRNALTKDYKKIIRSLNFPHIGIPSGVLEKLKGSALYKAINHEVNKKGEAWLYYLIIGDFEGLMEYFGKDAVSFEAKAAKVVAIVSLINQIDKAINSGCSDMIDYVNNVLGSQMQKVNSIGKLRVLDEEKNLDSAGVNSLQKTSDAVNVLLSAFAEDGP